MKIKSRLSKIGRAILVFTLVFAVEIRAQNLGSHQPGASIGSQGSVGLERAAEAEWVRGFRDGYELGFWSGIQDARALFPPNDKAPGYNTPTRLTPYRQGYFAGYADGYRQAFFYPWHPSAR